MAAGSQGRTVAGYSALPLNEPDLPPASQSNRCTGGQTADTPHNRPAAFQTGKIARHRECGISSGPGYGRSKVPSKPHTTSPPASSAPDEAFVPFPNRSPEAPDWSRTASPRSATTGQAIRKEKVQRAAHPTGADSDNPLPTATTPPHGVMDPVPWSDQIPERQIPPTRHTAVCTFHPPRATRWQRIEWQRARRSGVKSAIPPDTPNSARSGSGIQKTTRTPR